MTTLNIATEPIVSAGSSRALIVVRLELAPEAKRQSEAVADHFGMTQIAALSRLVEWFAGQPAGVQADVLTAQGNVARTILEGMAGRG